MPIVNLRLQNFRCFADTGTIRIAPITIVFGRNNSGKSSILQSLLLLRQTLDTPEYGERLNLRGPLYPAGGYADLVFQHLSNQHVTMHFGISDAQRNDEVRLELEFASDEPQPPRLVRFLVDPETGERLEIKRGRGRGGPFEMRLGRTRIGSETEANFRFGVSQLLPLIGDEPPRRGRPNLKRAEARETARSVVSEFTRCLNDVKAVGPFRQEPARRYEYQGHTPDVVDLRGRSVVNALIEDLTRRGKDRGNLFRTVDRWLKKVGHVALQPPRLISESARLYEIRLRDTDSGRWANFADVGFGIGQALPVLVEGLRTPPGGTFLVQEPEIHLHPDAQLQMADFLIDLARNRRCVVIETHSESLLLRVRRRVLEASRKPRSLKPRDVSIIYVDKLKAGTSRARTLPMDDLGQVEKWPAGFMEDSTQERMEILKRMAESSSKRR